jgi:hypothetical protein
MEKDFDRWHKLKKTINASDESERIYFHKGDIWWSTIRLLRCPRSWC